jgi:cytochrome c oxidase assembly protein subunit 15
MQPFWTNLFENIATVQFNHRLLAYLLGIVIPLFWWRMTRADVPHRARRAAQLLLGWLAVQVGLGIATLVHVTPVSLGAAHQAGALVLFSLALYSLHTLRRPRGVV